jgi:hypothetical protein
MKWFSLLWPLRSQNKADWIVLFLLVCHGKYPKHSLLVTAMFVDCVFSFWNVMFLWLALAVAMFCLTSILFVIVFVVVLRWFFRMFVASWSAISFPTIAACEGIHVNVILVPEAFKLKICLIISGIAGLDSHLKLDIA